VKNFNALNFAINILKNEKKFAKQMSKEMLKKINRIEKKFETGSLLEKIDKDIYTAKYEDILILFDNTIFMVKALIEDLGNSEKDQFSFLWRQSLLEVEEGYLF